MTTWVAISFGALDIRKHTFAEHGEYLVVPIKPSEPLFLRDLGASVWARLVASPVEESHFTDVERAVLSEMADAGLASQDLDHSNRITQVDEPWLVSPFHELVYAVLRNVSQQLDIEVIFIKGPALHDQGLRERIHSGDVDCWIPPGQERRLAKKMQPWGWTPVYSPFTGTPVPHSLTLSASGWRCAIDVHTYFPGMSMDPDEARTRLLTRIEGRRFASCDASTPTCVDHAVIAALHEMRPVHRPVDHRNAISASAILSVAGIEAIEATQHLSAGYALKPALEIAFPEADLSQLTLDEPPDWSWRVIASGPLRHRQAMAQVPFRSRSRVLFRLLWPTPASMRISLAEPTASVWTLSVMRIKRAAHATAVLTKRKR